MTKISMRTGTEGPHHDPYAFRELTVERDNRKHTLHLGLGDYYAFNGKSLVKSSSEAAVACWEAETGLTIQLFDRAYQHIHGPKSRCPHCNGKKLEWEQGHPGECLQVCASCKNIVYTTFNESEVI